LARACFVLALLNRPVLVGTRRPFVGTKSLGGTKILRHLQVAWIPVTGDTSLCIAALGGHASPH